MKPKLKAWGCDNWRIAIGRTYWWSNVKGRTRMDTLVGITRTWCRPEKVYIYRLILGRWTVGFLTKQS